MAERPSGPVELRHFRTETAPVPTRGGDQVLLRAVYVSVAPGARAVMRSPSYRPQLTVGEVIPSSAISEVVASPSGGPAPGTMVAVGNGGWQEYSLASPSEVRPLPKFRPLSRHLGLLGFNGLTAYFSVRAVASVHAGDTVVVSGAAGGVGHLAGQIARVHGARVVGITSSDRKNAMLVDQLGFAAAVNRTSDTVAEDLQAACPDGVDAFLDTVGGDVLNAVLPLLTQQARVALIGTSSRHDSGQSTPSPPDLAFQVFTKRLQLEGFRSTDLTDRWAVAFQDLQAMASNGDVHVLEDIRNGLEAAPQALVEMMSGGNLGQLAIRVRPEPADWPTD
ncbi:NADP-dependent oxidoreductase [Kibdelosporangium philippinense]|uniref:NADP-dependent oxidoreductase n=2 Tax=Kibdelosporangium philippinense TaxID=211113 RepID=A0ABS8Z2X6_9PSEU|nr:NADP-dependent oxidoreductase [Kibdelosporangium philippinense]